MTEQTITELLKLGKNLLTASNIPNPFFEAQMLLAAASGLQRHVLLINPTLALPTQTVDCYLGYLARRKQNEPVQYILNQCEFMSLNFYVDKNVLIPRGDTEVLVEKAIEIISKKMYTTILEIGTGSGCISVAIGKYLPNLKITAVDIDQHALNIAQTNARENVVKNIDFLQSDLFTGIQNKFDFIISNPPYIERDEIEKLEPNVKIYEPFKALDGGLDGLDFYRALCKGAPPFLCNGGGMIFEIGYNQQSHVSALLTENGFEGIEGIKDLAGLPRVVYGFLNTP